MRKVIVGVVRVVALVSSVSAVLAQESCEGNFDWDQDVDGTDAGVFKDILPFAILILCDASQVGCCMRICVRKLFQKVL